MPSPDARTTDLAALMPELLRVARRLVRNREAAEDLAQEALLKVWARLATGAEIEDLRSYLLATLRNTAKRPPPVADQLAEADEPSVPSDAPARLATKDVLRALDGLPEDQAVLLRGLAVEGADYADLARRHGLPIGTVMSRVSRGRARLARRLDLPRDTAVAELIGGG